MPAPGAYIVQQYTNLETGNELWTLYSDGSIVPPPGGGGAPGGVDGSIQFATAGAFDGNSVFTYDSTNGLQIDPVGTTPMTNGVNVNIDCFDTSETLITAGLFAAGCTHATVPTFVNNMYGVDGEVNCSDNANITTEIAVRALVAGINTATIGTAIGVDVAFGFDPGVTLTTFYGVHVPDVSGITAGLVRAIKVDGGNVEFDGPVGAGPNNAVGQIGPIGYASGNTTGSPRSRSLLDVEGSFTTPENLHFTTAAIVAGINANPAADDTNTSWYGIFATSQSQSANTHHVSELVGGLVQADHYASGVLDELNGLFVQTFSPTGSGAVALNIGIDISVQPASAATTPSSIGLHVKTGQYNASGTVTNNYGIQVLAPNTTGVLTHNYGLRIEDQTGGGANNPDPWAIYVVGGTTFLGGPIQTSNIITKYNNELTAGVGSSYIRGSVSQKNETGADANLLTVTPAAVAGLYRLTIVMDVSAATTGTGFGWTATWKDSNGLAHAPANLTIFLLGGATPGLTFSATANQSFCGEAVINIDNSATAIVIKTTFSGTSIAYKASATIERIG